MGGEQQPTVGRAVHYHPDPSRVKGDFYTLATVPTASWAPTTSWDGPWHATIAAVWPDGRVNLSVTYPDGTVSQQGRQRVSYDAEHALGTWSWPPRIG